jgi:hypothetical protein
MQKPQKRAEGSHYVTRRSARSASSLGGQEVINVPGTQMAGEVEVPSPEPSDPLIEVDEVRLYGRHAESSILIQEAFEVRSGFLPGAHD